MPAASKHWSRILTAAFVLLVAALVIALSGTSLSALLERGGGLSSSGTGLRGVIEIVALRLIGLLPAAHVLVAVLAAAYLWLSGAGLRSGRDVLDTALNVAARSLVTVAALWLGFVFLATIRAMAQAGT